MTDYIVIMHIINKIIGENKLNLEFYNIKLTIVNNGENFKILIIILKEDVWR